MAIVKKEIKSFQKILPAIAVILTGKSRYKPVIEWSNNSLTHNIFRVFESLFWAPIGIKLQVTTTYDRKTNTITKEAHTWEGFFALTEEYIRNALSFKVKKVYLPSPVFASSNGLQLPYKQPYLFAITYDASSTYSGVMIPVSRTITFNQTCTGSNRHLLLHTYQTGVALPNSASYNSVSMTNVVQNTASGNPISNIWSLSNPSSGTNTVSIASGGASSSHSEAFIASSYTGVKQTSPVGTSGTGASTSDNTVTTTTANSWIIDLVIGSGTPTVMTPTGTNQAEVISFINATGGTNTAGCAISRMTTTSVGNYSTSWTVTGAGTIRSCYLELKVASQATEMGATLQTYSVTFENALFVKAMRMIATLQTYAMTFQNALFAFGHTLTATVRTYTTTFQDAIFTKTVGMIATMRTYAVTFRTATFNIAVTMIASTVNYIMTFNPVTLLFNGLSILWFPKTKHENTTYTPVTKSTTTWTDKTKNE